VRHFSPSVRCGTRVPKSNSITTVYRFGPSEVNTASGELLKHGVRVKLQEQPFRLLIVLLENAGEPVTHEDLHRRIWENNTFVEFDSSLRVAVRKLRDALGDDADNPHYIETIPRKGYRFLGPPGGAPSTVDIATMIEANPIMAVGI
jgi:DNA-binding winged helix-turn-helix (wHTH) protein